MAGYNCARVRRDEIELGNSTFQHQVEFFLQIW
jgi:hypothetical protein